MAAERNGQMKLSPPIPTEQEGPAPRDFCCSSWCRCLVAASPLDRECQFPGVQLHGANCALSVASSEGNEIYQKVIWMVCVGYLPHKLTTDRLTVVVLFPDMTQGTSGAGTGLFI